MKFLLIIIFLILFIALLSLLFWVWILVKGIFSRKRKLPYIWGLYFLISIIFYFSKRIITDSATDRTFIVIMVLFILFFIGIYHWRSGKMSWETIEKSWSIDNVDKPIEKKGRGSFINKFLMSINKFLIKLFGQTNVYYGAIVVIFIFPVALFLI